MSEIKKGDLVMIVRPAKCCGTTRGIGRVHTIIGAPKFQESQCVNCGRIFPVHHFGTEFLLDNDGTYEISRLRRLDPDALKDDMPIKEELHA